MSESSQDPMMDIYIFETTQLLEQLEQIIINSEKSSSFQEDSINEIFRIMHTIKGSSAMMLFQDISMLSHSVEDLIYFVRKEKCINADYSVLSDIILESLDFIKGEIQKIRGGSKPDGSASDLITKNNSFLASLKEGNLGKETGEPKKKKEFKAVLYFEEGCEMENIRAYAVIHNLKEIADEIYYIPENITDDESSAQAIQKEGFQIWLKSDRSYEEIHHFFAQTIFLKDLELAELPQPEQTQKLQDETQHAAEQNGEALHNSLLSHQNMISVNVDKLDKLMDFVGELVISEAMLTNNSDLKGLSLDSFQKSARQHRKIINELQDIAMSIRMVPLSMTFRKMNRIVRDMSKKLSKQVDLKIIGEETEVDKNIIEHISDPLMHLIRNSIDHGIEPAEERKVKGKAETGTITLEAKNSGGDVLIIIKDDGRGLNREKILSRAIETGLITRPESELTDKEIYSCIFQPGFSTKDEVTEYSGRGVGMDVVSRNIGAIGGTISIDSVPDKGTTIILKIPLTLAIMDGMTIQTGKAQYTIPIISIKESFKVQEGSVMADINGQEMIMLRGDCYPVLRLHALFKIKTEITELSQGIIVMVEHEGKNLCIFTDRLIGEQQVVVKALPDYIKKFKRLRGLGGCTLLGDGSISLILDIGSLLENKI